MNTPLRYLALSPLLVAATAGLVVGVSMGAGAAIHPGPMLLACGICLAAAELALTPMLLAPSRKDARVRAALLGTVVHLGVVLLAGVVCICLLRPAGGFVFWLLGEYWVTLIGSCIGFVHLLNVADPLAGRS